LESGKPLSKAPSDEWFDVPEGREDKYRNNAHYETDEGPARPAPKRSRAKAEPKPEAPKIETDGWEGDE
jgi:hypothetical protein